MQCLNVKGGDLASSEAKLEKLKEQHKNQTVEERDAHLCSQLTRMSKKKLVKDFEII